MDPAIEFPAAMVSGTGIAGAGERSSPGPDRATVPRRIRLQGNQGPAGAGCCQRMAERPAAGLAGKARTGTPAAVQRSPAKTGLSSRRVTAYGDPDPTTLRRQRHSAHCDGTGAGAGPHPGAEYAPGSDYAGSGRVLARSVPAREARAATQISTA